MREARFGMILHGITLISLIIHGAYEGNLRKRRFLLSLSLAPLIRLLSLSLPLAGRPLVEWYFFVGALLFVGAYSTARLTGLDRNRLGFNTRFLPAQLVFGISGLGLGLLEYLILRPEPLVKEFSLGAIWLPALILAIFTGLLEELIFRGLIQESSLATYGKFGLTYGAVVFAVLHVGYGSVLDVAFVFGVALLFGIFVLKTGSIFGVTISHSLTNISLFLIYPFVFAGSISIPVTNTTTVPQQSIVDRSSKITIFTELLEDASKFVIDLPILPSESIPTQTPTLDFLIQGSECEIPVGWVSYTIQSGDTLFSISQSSQISLDELVEVNCLDKSTSIRTGEKLFLPNQ